MPAKQKSEEPIKQASGEVPVKETAVEQLSKITDKKQRAEFFYAHRDELPYSEVNFH